jgi:hypothetical protein
VKTKNSKPPEKTIVSKPFFDLFDEEKFDTTTTKVMAVGLQPIFCDENLELVFD